MSKLQQIYLKVVKYIIRCIKITINFGLLYQYNNSYVVHGYTNVDWVSCLELKSLVAHIILYYLEQLSLGKIKGKSIAKSSTKLKYMSFLIRTSEAIWLKKLLTKIETIDGSSSFLLFSNASKNILSNMQAYCSLLLHCHN